MTTLRPRRPRLPNVAPSAEVPHHTEKVRQETNYKLQQLRHRFNSFHEDVEITLQKALGKRSSKIKEISEESLTEDEKPHERLAAVSEIKKTVVWGPSEPVKKATQEGYKESQLKFVQFDPVYFLETDEKKKAEETVIQNYAIQKADWVAAVSKVLDSGAAKTMDTIQLPKHLNAQKRRNAILKTKGSKDFSPRFAWAVAIYRIVHMIRSMKEKQLIDTFKAEKSLVSQLREFQSQADSMTKSKVSLNFFFICAGFTKWNTSSITVYFTARVYFVYTARV